jgi:hypothetical protein
MSQRNEEWQRKIMSTNSVFIHVRRGDYVTNPAANTFHGICDLSYYKSAIDRLNTIITKPVYYIFSDDVKWVTENIGFDYEHHVVSGSDSPAHEEMNLMSCCKNGIIANSSFSWWGAWLIRNKDKQIIAPQNWFADKSMDTTDLIPASWQRI